MQTDVGQPTDQPAVSRSVSRRTVLQFLGLGAGFVALAGATGLTRRAVDGGVFATGTGPAYAAWDQADPTGHDPLNLVRAAILAANAYLAIVTWWSIATPVLAVLALLLGRSAIRNTNQPRRFATR